MVKVQEIDPVSLKKLIDNGQTMLIDVREHLEYNEEHIPKARLFPSSKFRPEDLPNPADKKMIFYCLSGKRSSSMGRRWADYCGVKEVYFLKGGLESWKNEGLPTVVNHAVEKKIERQAYVLAGFLVLVGSLLSIFFTDWFLILPGLIGALLIFSGYAGHCYLTFLLSRLPFNR